MHSFKRVLTVFSLVIPMLGGVAVAGAPAASPPGASALQQAVNAQLERAPSGTQVSDDTVSYDNGDTLVIIADPSQSTTADPDVTGPCPSGFFCIWANINKGGNRYQWKDTGVFDDLAAYGVPEPYGSFQNNRGQRMFMHKNDHGTPEQCYTGGTYVSNASPWYDRAYAIYLATTSTC